MTSEDSQQVIHGNRLSVAVAILSSTDSRIALSSNCFESRISVYSSLILQFALTCSITSTFESAAVPDDAGHQQPESGRSDLAT